MDISEAIFSRRTIKDFKPDRVPDEILERALTAGQWAQNHRMTEPWRFIVLGPETHRLLAATEQKLMTKPRIIGVACRLNGDIRQQREDYAAVCCAIQNIQLVAWAEGVGMQWSTGRVVQLPQTSELLNVDTAHEELVGLLYFGYPATTPAPPARKPLAEVMQRLP